MNHFNGRVGLVQRVLPGYRVPFFNALGQVCQSGLGVFAGKPRPGEMIDTANSLEHAQFFQLRNWHLFKNKFYLCIQNSLLPAVKAWNPDVLIVEANPRYLLTQFLVRWMQAQERPVIGWGLGAPPLEGFLAKLRQKRRARFINQFNVLITYSQTGAKEYSRLGFPRERIYVAVNAVTPPPLHPLPERSNLQGSERLQVLFVGRLQKRKNLYNLLQACARMPQNLQPTLTIVGEGPERPALENLAKEIYPPTIFTGALYGDPLEYQFKSADLFVLPGTGGLAIQQAMSFGLPIIAAEADGTQADLVRPENGWQIPPNNIPALQATLQTALSDLSKLRKMGAESYRLVSEEINLDKMVTTFVQAIKGSLS